MRNKIEHFLLSLLLGTSVLLGLSFWLNIKYGFNLFNVKHWAVLSKLQAGQIHVSIGFYVSFIIAFITLAIGVYAINFTQHKRKQATKTEHIVHQEQTIFTQPTNTKNEQQSIRLTRPARLNLPSNIETLAQRHHDNASTQSKHTNQSIKNNYDDKYNNTLSEIFSNNGYVVKQNPTISGLTTNLFAIGNNEVVWIGATDCTSEQMEKAVQKLQSVFSETLEDITINIYPFILDTIGTQNTTENILVFHSLEDLKAFISENPAAPISDLDTGSFDSYSEYIDTIIQYIKNI